MKIILLLIISLSLVSCFDGEEKDVKFIIECKVNTILDLNEDNRTFGIVVNNQLLEISKAYIKPLTLITHCKDNNIKVKLYGVSRNKDKQIYFIITKIEIKVCEECVHNCG